jgi:formylglycine-generating enzyme required for sulfatase activity
MFCPECGTENRSNARFCKGCGLRFDDDGTGETVSPYETTISIQPAEPSRTTVFATPSYTESSSQDSAFKLGDSNPAVPPAAPTVPVSDRTAVFGGNNTAAPNFDESSSTGLIFGDAPITPTAPPPPLPAASESPILLIGQEDLAPPTVPNTPFPINPHEPETVPNRPSAPIPPTAVMAAVPPPVAPVAPVAPPPIPPTAVMAAVPPPTRVAPVVPPPPPPIPPTVVMGAVPPPNQELPSGFAGVMPLRTDPAPAPPSGAAPLPPDIAAQPFKPIAPPGGTPRPMGQTRPVDHAAARPPADLFSQPAPTPAAEGKKSKMPLVLGLLGGLLVLAVLLGGIGFVAYQRFAKPKPAPEPVKVDPPEGPATPTTEPPPSAPVVPADMIAIPAGEYQIGRNSGDLFDKYESPQHPVTLKAFYIDKTEVTNADYKKFMDATGHAAPSTWVNGQIKPGTEYFPVSGVAHADAEAYAKWAGKRLPTEEEWEAAAHGRTPSLFPWGNEQDFSRMNIKPSGIDAPVRVGASPAGASPFGVMDMSGNVWEWTATEAAAYPGSTETVVPNSSGKRQMVIRGGAFNEKPARCTTTFRNWVPADFKGKELGFRCVKSQ